MIFALGEDGCLDVFEDIKAMRDQCEGIDVESGVWDFFGENGEPLTASFCTPNKVISHVFGLFSTVKSSQDFGFATAKVNEPWLQDCLSAHTILKPNGRFSSMTEVRT